MSDALPLLKSLITGHTDTGEEEQILALLGQADIAELNALLAGVDVDELFNSVDDHVGGPANQQHLVELLGVRRRRELTLPNRAELIHALQTGRTPRDAEEAIVACFTDLHGAELTRLKNLINMRTDHHDLEALVFVDLRDEGLREQLLEHFAREADGLEINQAKVLSDIDDTIFCKLNDKRYPRGTIYPGALAFLDALDDGPDENPFSDGDLTFVTARPGDFFGLVENHSRAALRKAGISELSVLSGSLLNLHTNSAIAERKLVNVEHYHRLFGEYTMVFMGDSGQGDVIVGQRMMETFGEHVTGVFIHDVVHTPDADRARHADARIFFHDTYVGAAAKAYELGLISATGLDHVAAEAVRGVERVPWHSIAQRAKMVELFERDLAALPV